MKLLMKIVKSSLNEIDILGTRQETRAIVWGYRRDIASSISGSTMSEIGNIVFQNYYTKPNEKK